MEGDEAHPTTPQARATVPSAPPTAAPSAPRRVRILFLTRRKARQRPGLPPPPSKSGSGTPTAGRKQGAVVKQWRKRPPRDPSSSAAGAGWIRAVAAAVASADATGKVWPQPSPALPAMVYSAYSTQANASPAARAPSPIDSVTTMPVAQKVLAEMPQRSDASFTPAPTMPPPPVPHPAAGTFHVVPSAESIPPSRSDLSLTFRMHPVVVANIIAHYTRVNDQDAYRGDNSSSGATAAQPQRIFGCVIGVQHRTKVEIYNSFELEVDPASGALDRALFLKEKKRYRDLFPNMKVKGWYSTGSHVQDTDMEIHRRLQVVDHSSVFLLLSPTINPSQMDLPITIYESDLRYISQKPSLIFVRPKHTIEFVKKALSTEAQSPNHLHVEETASTVIATMPLEEGEDANFKRCAFRRMLFETQSGFVMFGIDDKVFRRPEDIWACFTHLCDAKDVIFKIGDIKFENKSIAWDVNAGPGEDLANFILKFCNRKALIVQDLKLKQVIETKLGIQCWFNEQIVPELTWGLNFVVHEFVPEEREQYHLPLSKELEKKIKIYGFNVSKQVIDRDFIKMIGRLKYFEYTADNIFKFLHDKFDHCFSGVDMSKAEYVEGIGNLLSSEPSVEMQYKMSVKEDI